MKHLFFLILFVLVSGCKSDDENPVNPGENKAAGYIRSYVNGENWEASDIYASKSGDAINISAVKNSSEIRINILNINQPGNFSIGENEPGFTYFIKAKYIDKNGGDKTYTAYFRDYSFLSINNISEGSLDADFIFKAFTEDFSDSVVVTNGAIDIDY